LNQYITNYSWGDNLVEKLAKRKFSGGRRSKAGGTTLTALPAAMRYILKAESYDRRGARGKSYCIIAGSAVKEWD